MTCHAWRWPAAGALALALFASAIGRRPPSARATFGYGRAEVLAAFVNAIAMLAMAVIGGISLSGGRGSIIGTVLGALMFGVIISGFTFMKLDAYYQEMVKGVIIVGAVVLDQWRQRRSSGRA